MSSVNPVNQALLTLLDNQERRTAAAFEGLSDECFAACPGRDCNTIAQIGEHLIRLRGFQLKLLGSSRAGDMPNAQRPESVADLLSRLKVATQLVRQALAEHDPNDWFAIPNPPREGHWGDESTISRVMRPLNDFTNHLGGVRAIRRIYGEPATNVQ